MKSRILFNLIIFLSVLNSFGQTLEQKIDSIMTSKFKADGAGAVALVSKNGQIVYHKAFGMANLELNVPMKKEMVFEIASMTKQFTAISILMLLEQGKLTLEDDITKHINDYPTNGNKITIHNLLNHTSGIKELPMTDWISFYYLKKDFAPIDFINHFKTEPQTFKPNEKWEYCNGGYFILGYIIEKISGLKYEEFIQNNIFNPLKMNASYCRVGNINKVIKDRAYGYDKNEKYYNAEYLDITQPYAAGCIMSTVEDLFKWNNALQNNTLVKKETLEKAFTNYELTNGKKTNYGYGFLIRDISGSKSYEHGGGIPGFASHGIYLQNEKVFVTALSNCRLNDPASETAKIAGLVISKPFTNKKELLLNDTELNKLKGSFKATNSNSILEVTVENQKLFVRVKGSDQNSQLIPYSKDKFYIKNEYTEYEFILNDKKEITGLIHKTRFRETTFLKVT